MVESAGTQTGSQSGVAATEHLPIDEANFRAFFDHSVDFLFVLDEQGSIITANNTVFERLGYEEAEIAGRSVLVVHPPELRDEAARITRAMLQGEKESCPLPLMTKNGDTIAVETRVVGGVMWDGKPAMFGISKDISSLRLSEEQFSEVFRSSPTMMAIAESDTGRILNANRAFFKSLGYSAAEVTGRTPEDLDLFEQAFQYGLLGDSIERGGVHNASTIVRTKSGERIEAVLNVHPIRVQQHDRVIIEMQDVSRLMRARRELAESEKRLERVLSGAGVGAWDWDIVTNHVHYDERWCQMLGYEQFEIASTIDSWERLVHPEDAPIVQQVLNAHLRGETDWYETEHRMRTRDGGWVWVLDRGRVISRRIDGAPVRMSGTHLDITVRKEAEEALKSRDRLLQGLAEATNQLLAAGQLEEHRIGTALRNLGEAALVDRAYIFEQIDGDPGTRGFCSQRYEWSRDEVEPQIDNPDLQDVPWEMTASRWYDVFIEGGFIAGDVADFPQDEREALEPQDIISLLALPITSGGRLWGFIGFDSCVERRQWSDSEVSMLRAAGNAFGVAIERERIQTRLDACGS